MANRKTCVPMPGTASQGRSLHKALAALLDGPDARARAASWLRGGRIDGLGEVFADALRGAPAHLSPTERRRLQACWELGRSFWCAGPSRPKAVRTSLDAYLWLRTHGALATEERLWTLTLDTSGGVLSLREVARGRPNACASTIKGLLRPAIRDGAAGMVVAHNHPSRDLVPSASDLAMTEALQMACVVSEVSLMDHLIIAPHGYCSFADEGVLTPETWIRDKLRSLLSAPPAAGGPVLAPASG